MSQKRKYRSVGVKDVKTEGMALGFSSERVVVGIDVAKSKLFAAVMDEARAVHVTVRWEHPAETPEFVAFVKGIAAQGVSVEVAMEPSGVYGDPLREALGRAGFQVFRVSPKRSHDAAEVYDGVPSWHDAKCCAIVAKLHLDGASEEWPIEDDRERALTAAVRLADVFGQQFQANRNRLEALTARYWPELTHELDLDTATLLELLIEYGGPAGVAEHTGRARELMKRIGGNFLDADKIERIVASAGATIGVRQIPEERDLVRALAAEARRNQRAEKEAVARIEELTKDEGSVEAMSKAVGKKTSAVVVAAVGDPTRYDSANAFVKSLGLNLKEKSSGNEKGALHITKRGPGVARRVLYLAALRMIRGNAIVGAWYAKKVARMGGALKAKAVVAVMRKIAAALWHVAKGTSFEASRLFDTSRLDLGRPVTL